LSDGCKKSLGIVLEFLKGVSKQTQSLKKAKNLGVNGKKQETIFKDW